MPARSPKPGAPQRVPSSEVASVSFTAKAVEIAPSVARAPRSRAAQAIHPKRTPPPVAPGPAVADATPSRPVDLDDVDP